MIEKETGGVVLLYIHILFYKGTFSGESMQQRKRTDTLVLDESISELSGSHAQINNTIAAVTFCCQIKKTISYLGLSVLSLTRSLELSCFLNLFVF